MIPLEAIKYIALSAILVMSLFVGLRLIFAHPVRQEAWRSWTKQYIYFSRPWFRRTTLILGCILFFIGLVIAYFTVIGLMN